VIGVLLAVAVLGLAGTGPDDARARLAYVHDGSIYSIASDGSDRRPIANGFDPAFSPSGDALAFSRSRSVRRGAIAIATPDGSEPRTLVEDETGALLTPAWSPDGSQIAFARFALKRDALESAIEVVRADGSGRRAVVRLRATRGFFTVADPVWSPDGQRLLYTRSGSGRNGTYRFDIRSAAVAGGADSLFLRDASGGAFSPDGTRFAFADYSELNGMSCGSDECYPHGELAVAGADGSARRVLFESEGDEGEPSWSSDGTRIAFGSARNTPTVSFAEPEVYTIAPDGSCLTWLTNGTPGSGTPDWAPGPGVAAPPACGAGDRQPLVEVEPTRRARGSRWLGPQLGTALLSHVQGRGRATLFAYEDCSEFDPRACLPAFVLVQHDSCRRRAALRFELRALRNPRRVRGGAIRGDSPGLILTGRTAMRVQIVTEATRVQRKALYARVLGALRRSGEEPGGRLPAPVLPRNLKHHLPPRLRDGVRSCRRS